MACEYLNEGTNKQRVVCSTVRAIGQVYKEMDGVIPVKELREILCLNGDCQAREQCPAYALLAQYGKASGWAK